MTVRLPYGDCEIAVEVPDSRFGGIVELGEVPTLPDPHCAADDELTTAGLSRFIAGVRRLLLVVNDTYRMTPTPLALDCLSRFIGGAPEVRKIVATGLHARPTDEDVKSILGSRFAMDRDEISFSDAYDCSQFELIGKWKDGSEILVNRAALWADRIIVIGSVEPHYFAGFTGGPKSFVPGLCFCSTIEANHKLAADMSAQPCRLLGNPVAESIREAVGFLDLRKVFSIQFVTDSVGAVAGVFAGDLSESHDRAVECSRRVYMRPVKKRFRVVVAAHSRPLDRNLYQLQKAFENTVSILEDGGELVVLSACIEGIGNDEFYRMAEIYPSPESILSAQDAARNLGFHKLYRTALHLKRIRISVKCELTDETVRRIYLEPAGDLQKKVNELLSKYGDNSEVVFVKDAGYLVPYVDRAA
jgi:nickel-dependent lactate racemase